jgi:hypothetical protein
MVSEQCVLRQLFLRTIRPVLSPGSCVSRLYTVRARRYAFRLGQYEGHALETGVPANPAAAIHPKIFSFEITNPKPQENATWQQ